MANFLPSSTAAPDAPPRRAAGRLPLRRRDHLTSDSDGSSGEAVPPTPTKPNPHSPIDEPRTGNAAEIPIKRTAVEGSSKKMKSKKRKRRGGGKKHEDSPGKATQEGTRKEEQEKVLFQKIWSDEDEIALLKGMLDHAKVKGRYAMTNSKDFHGFIKESLSIDVGSNQVRDKVRKLKDKYKKSFAKKTLNPHEKEVMELGIQIWGREHEECKSEGNRTECNGAGKVYEGHGIDEGAGEMWSFLQKAPMNLDENIVKSGLKHCDKDRVAEVEHKWRMLHMEEAEIYTRKMALCHETMEMITEGLRSNHGTGM